jgi:hypothetical protein
MDRFGATDCHGSLPHVTEEQPEDPVHLNTQAPRDKFFRTKDGKIRSLVCTLKLISCFNFVS